jgi:hypothetical protein
MMAIVDPFDTPAKGIVDPFENQGKTKTDQASPGVWSDFGEETAKAFKSGFQHLSPTPSPPDRGDSFWSGLLTGPFERGVSGIERAAAPLEIATAPITGAIHAFGGRALAGLEGYAGEASLAALKRLGLTKDQIQTPDQQQMYEQAKADIDKAMLAAGPARAGAVTGAPWGGIGQAVEADIAAAKQAAAAKAATPPPIPPELSPVEAALERRKQAGQPVDIPRAITSESPTIRAGGQALSVAPIVGTPLREAVQAVPAQVGGHIEDIAAQFGAPLPENIVGGGVERRLSDAARQEAAARQAEAEAADAAAQQKFESDQQAREQAIRDRQAQATNAAERTFGDVAPMEMAQDTINDVQSAHRQARDRKNSLYDAVNNLDARVQTSAFSDLRQRAEQALSDAGVSIDDPGSNASNMLRELDRLSGQPGELPANVPPRLMQALQREYGGNVPASALEQLGFPGGTDAVPPDFRLAGAHAPPPGADAISVQGLERLNKRIGGMGMRAVDAEDRFASRIVKGAFDDWRNDVLGSHLTADSAANARPVIDAARAAHRDLMDRFGYNYRRLPEGEPRNAAKMLNQIVTGGLGPEGLRDNLIGAKPGNRRVSAPLYEAVSNAVPNAGEFRNRVRGAYWNTISAGSPKSIASDVAGLTPTRMGSHLFEPHEHDLMRGFADLAQRTPQEIAEVRKAKPPKPIKVEPGKAEQLASRVLGRNRSDETVLSKFDSAIREGGNIKEAARVWGKLSGGERDEVRGNWLRNMGGGGENFSVGAFLKNWNAYSKQAKSFMLDREHRAAIDDFHTALSQYADTISKYGNPSGTAQVSAWHKLAAMTVKGVANIPAAMKGAAGAAAVPVAAAHLPLTIGTVIGGLGLRKVAKILAIPQGARDISRWNRVAQSYRSAPSAGKLTVLSNLTRTLNAAGE